MVATVEAQLPVGTSDSQMAASGFGDCILQIQSHLLAHRVVLYHQDHEIRYRLFPKGGAEQVIHLPKFKDIHASTNELVLFKNLAVSQIEFKRWIDSSLLRFYITRAYFLDGLEANSYEDLLHQMSQMDPPKNDLFRVVAYPKFLEQHIINTVFMDNLLDKGWDIHPLEYTKTVFAVLVNPTCIRFSLRPADEVFLTLPDGPSRVVGQKCKATGKLTEALLLSGFEPRKGGVAIDVGASPGGWTQVLAKTMETVVAVDPAALDADILALPNVVHIRKQSQECTEEIMAAVGQDRTIDLLVCDINKHPGQMMPILTPLLSLLRSGGMIILTLKFRGRGKEKAGGLLVEKFSEELGPEYHKVKVLWLLANTENERTAVAVKK